jgi:DNA-binding transcriptional regulator YiaG
VTALRQLRRDANLSQHALAALLAVPVNTLRMWDSGLRSTPAHVVTRAAGKAVVYQWESRKRTPSPVLWQRVLKLDGSRS